MPLIGGFSGTGGGTQAPLTQTSPGLQPFRQATGPGGILQRPRTQIRPARHFGLQRFVGGLVVSSGGSLSGCGGSTFGSSMIGTGAVTMACTVYEALPDFVRSSTK